MITLATLSQATPQEVFDQVKNHLLTQNAPSLQLGSNTLCQYRGHNGLKCAAGCLISDEEYFREMESNGTWEVLVDKKIAPKEHEYLISSLQNIHDCYTPNCWEGELKKLADKSGLTF